MTQRTGQLYIISAPSGAGKTSLIKKLVTMVPDIKTSISYTTRPKRDQEVHGKNYFFTTPAEFTTLQAEDAFLESAEIYGNHYGTPRDWVKQQLDLGIDVILEIDVQGAAQVKTKAPDATSIFILPPSLEELRNRLELRNSETSDVIQTRLDAAKSEITAIDTFDYMVINQKFAQALDELKAIILGQRQAKHHFILPEWVDNLKK